MTLDLNADIGEGLGDPGVDEALLTLISSANIACGFHASDPETMRTTSRVALENDVRIGAHVSYWDREGFGRRELGFGPERVQADVAYQIGALMGCAALSGGRVTYVKPHGALYGRCHHDAEMAQAVVSAVRDMNGALQVMAAPGSRLQAAAEEAAVEVILEGFVDRCYQADGQLAPRFRPGAVLGEIDAVRQAASIINLRAIKTDDGSTLPLSVDSLCVHSDTPWAVPVARRVRELLDTAAMKHRGHS